MYFSVENDDASVDNCKGTTGARTATTSNTATLRASGTCISPASTDIASASQVSSQIHSRLQPSAQVNCNLNRHHGNHLSVLRHNHQHQQRRHTQSHHQDHGLFCGNTLTGDDTPSAVYDSGCPKQLHQQQQHQPGQDQHRHSHQSYFSHCQINNDSSPKAGAGIGPLLYPGSPFTPCHGAAASKRYSERSRIKTNPWLRSPWTTPQRKCLDQCPSSSSVSGSNGNSSDSGCSLIPSSNALGNSSQTRTAAGGGGGGPVSVTRTRDTTCDSVGGMVTTPSSSISSANATPTTDEEAALHCCPSVSSPLSSSSSTAKVIRATVNGAASKSITGASSTLKCDINKNRLANNVASASTTTTGTNNTSGKRILSHRSSCDSSRLYPSCSPRRNSSSGSLSSNNNNSNFSHICNGGTTASALAASTKGGAAGGVVLRRRSKDQSSNKNPSLSGNTNATAAADCTTTTTTATGGLGASRIPCTAFRAATATTASTLATTGPGGSNSSNSSSCSRRRKRRSRVQSTGSCTGNRISLLTSIVNATNPTSAGASSSNSPSSLTEKSSSGTGDGEHPHHRSTCPGGSKVKRRTAKSGNKVLPYQLSSPSTSSSTSSLAQLPAPPDSASSQLILQDILTNLATSAKNNLKQPSNSLNHSPLEGSVKRIQVRGNSFNGIEGQIESNLTSSIGNGNGNSNSNNNSSCNSNGISRRDDADDAAVAVAVGEINSQADERTTRQEASCLFSDVILLHSNCQGSNNKNISSNLSRRNNQSQLRPEILAAGTRNSSSQESTMSKITSTSTSASTSTCSSTNTSAVAARPPPPRPPPRCNLEKGKEIEGSYHNKHIRQQRSPYSGADTLRATYEEQSSEHRSTSESPGPNTPPSLLGVKSDAECDGDAGEKKGRKERQEQVHEKEKEVKGKTQSPEGTGDDDSSCITSNCSSTCTTTNTTATCTVKLRRNVNNCSSAQYHHNASRQSAPVFVDLASCPPKELVTSPMTTSMIAMGTVGEGSGSEHLPGSVYTGSNDCFTITPSSSRGSSVSFSRSSSMSSSRPGSLVSGSAALSVAGRRYYSSLLNKRRFVPSCIDQMNHPSLASGSSSSSLFKRLSAMSNEEWVSTATEELICSDEDEQEETEYESESSLVANDVKGIISLDSSRGCQFGNICKEQSRQSSDTQLNYTLTSARAKEPACQYNEEVIASVRDLASTLTCGERVHQNYQEGASVTLRSKEKGEGAFNYGPVASVTMTHDSEITTCGQEEGPSTVAAVTASAVSRRRKEWAQTNDTLSYTKNRGGGSYIRAQSTSSTSNCMTTSPAAAAAAASASVASPSVGSIVNPCLSNNCKMTGNATASGSNSLRSSGLSGRKNESSALLASVCKEDIHARGLFEARHLREMRKETKATLMQVNENIDSTFSPLQQLRLVSERLEQLLKMEEESSGSNTLTLFVHGKEHQCKEQNEQENRDYTNGQSGCSHVTQSTRTHERPNVGPSSSPSPCFTSSSFCSSSRLVRDARDLPSRNLPLSSSPDPLAQEVDSASGQTCDHGHHDHDEREVNLNSSLTDVKCTTNLPLACESSGHAISKSPNLLHLSPLTPETPMTEDSGVEISCSSLTPSGDSNASISSCQVTSICTLDAPKGIASLDATVNSCTVTRSVDTSDSPVDVTTSASSSSTQITWTSAFQSGSSASGGCVAKNKPVSSSSSSSSSSSCTAFYSSSTSQHDRRVRRTMEHEKLWQQIAARLSLNDDHPGQQQLHSSVSSLLNSFIANSAKENTDASVSLSPRHSSSLPPVNQALGQ